MNKFIKNIFKVSFSNIVSLMSGVLVGFLVPKMMGLEGYANYKIYTLYLTYLALLSLGLGDGLYLKFSGTDKENLDITQIRFYLRKYYVQLVLLVIPSLVLTLFFADGAYRFILISLSLTMLSSQVTAVHQNLSIITSRFNEYSVRVITKSILTSILVIVLFVIFNYSNTEISYKVYVAGVVLIDYILAAWYVFTYREFNFGTNIQKPSYSPKYYELLVLGFPLLLSNMAGSIFLNLDRQFVSVLFSREEYAIYAFAYNMLTLITTMTSAISLVLFPSLRKIQDIDVKESIETYGAYFSIVVSFCLMVFFPLTFVVNWFLPKYVLSLDIFRIVLPGIMLSSSVSVIFINFYKLENKVKLYFGKTILAMIVSAILNYAAYAIFRDYEWISWASIFSLLFWYIVVDLYFIRKYRVKWIKNIVYLLTIMSLFYLITNTITSRILGMLLYISIYSAITCFFYMGMLSKLMKKVKR